MWTSAVCCLVLTVLGNARSIADFRADETVAVKQVLKVGDSIQLKSTISVVGQDVTVVQIRKQTVKELKENGDAVIIVTLLGGKYTVNGADNDIPAGAPTTVTANKYSRILTYKLDNDDNPYLSASTMHLLAFVDTIIFPDKPVRAGDSWTSEIDNPAMTNKKLTIKTTFVGANKADGKDVWKVKQTLSADTDSGKMTADTTATLDASNGQLMHAEMDVKGVPTKIGGPVDWTIKLVRVKGDEKGDEKVDEKPTIK
jgi:hypothetical protein